MFVEQEMAAASCTTQRSLPGEGGVDCRCSVRVKVLTLLNLGLLFPVPLGQRSLMGSEDSCFPHAPQKFCSTPGLLRPLNWLPAGGALGPTVPQMG